MPKESTKKRKKDLGIFYTPQEVVSFIYEILIIWKNKEDERKHRWQTRKPRPHYPSVIDPACGEGIFLKTAVTSNFTGYHPTEKTPYVFGVDLDGEVVKKWEEISILHDLFKGKKKKMLNHFHQQDGLLELPKKVFDYKTGGLKEFDAVVGNPPYGGIGFSSLKEKSTIESIQILEHLRKFDILSYRKRKKKNNGNQASLWGSSVWGAITWGGGNHLPSTKEAESIPIEVLFIDRFIQLAKPGGWIAIIIPDGVLTNSNSHYVREFISHRTKVEAIVSLPRGTFKNVGTNAKTSILFLKKLKKSEKPKDSYPVFLASTEKIKVKNFNKIVKSYKKIYNSGESHMNKANSIQITKDQGKREAVMVRVDRTLKDLMKEKPTSRWTPNYWLPIYDDLLIKHQGRFSPLGKFIDGIWQGDVPRKKFEEKIEKAGIPFIEVDAIENTGIHWYRTRFVSEKQYLRLKRVVPEKDSIYLVRSGATIGKVAIIKQPQKAVCNGHINKVTVKNIDPYYLVTYLKTYFGQEFLKRLKNGTGQDELNFDEISVIPIADIKEAVQRRIRAHYLRMNEYHKEAVEARRKKDEKKYEENLKTAERLLENLIKKTEQLIEGKRENID